MITSVNLSYAHYTNIVGLTICFVVVMTSKWRFKEHNRTNRILILLLFCVVISCLMHSVAVWVDGMPGSLARKAVYASNTWLFIANTISGFLWIMFMEETIHGTNSALHFRILQLISLIGFITLFINLYVPIVFYVNAKNVYSRRELFYLSMIIEVCFLLDAFYMYLKAKYVKGVITVFPVWTYIIPIFIGMFIQLMVYGASLIWPCSAVSVAIMFNSFNVEDRYRDILTGVYNRTYLEVLRGKFMKRKNKQYIALRVNLMGMGALASVLGKEVENDARVSFARVLTTVSKPIGLVTQYDKDSYVIFFSAKNEKQIDDYMQRIMKQLEELNHEKRMSYSLSVEMDYSLFEVDKDNMEEIIKDLGKTLENRKINEL